MIVKVTVEYLIDNLIDEESLKEDYGGNIFEAYKSISDDCFDSPMNFTDESKVVKVEVI